MAGKPNEKESFEELDGILDDELDLDIGELDDDLADEAQQPTSATEADGARAGSDEEGFRLEEFDLDDFANQIENAARDLSLDETGDRFGTQSYTADTVDWNDEAEAFSLDDDELSSFDENAPHGVTETADPSTASVAASAAAPAALAGAAAARPTSDEPRPAAQPREERFAAANDDDRRKDYRATVNALRRRAPLIAYWFAAFLSIAWFIGTVTIAGVFFGAPLWEAGSLEAIAQSPALLITLLVAFIPCLLFFAYASLIRRAQEMRMVAQSMTEIAYRLVEPEELAMDRVHTVGSAVRREVRAMQEGIDSAINRAAGLESVMRGEMNELERAYAENEVRMRGLLDGLAHERDAVSHHAERMRETVRVSHEAFRDELTDSANIIRDNILKASTSLSSQLSLSGEGLANLLDERIGEISSIAGSVGSRLDETATPLVRRIAETTTELDSAIERMAERGRELETGVSSTLDERLAALDERGQAFSTRFAEAVDSRLQTLDTRGDAFTQKFAEAVDGRLQTLDARGEAFTERFAEAVDGRLQTLDEKSGLAENRIGEVLDRRMAVLNERGVAMASTLANTFDERIARLDESTSSFQTGLASSIDARIAELSEIMAHRTEALSTTFNDGTRSFADTVTAGEEGFVGKISDQLDRLDQTLHGHIQSFDVKITGAADSIGETFEDRTRHVFERFNSAGEQLGAQFDGRLEAIRVNLDERGQMLLGEFDTRAETLERNTERLNDALQSRADALNSTLLDRTRELAGTLNTARESLTGSIDEGSQRLSERMAELSGEMAKVVDDRLELMASRLEEGRQRISTALDHDVAEAERLQAELAERIAGEFAKGQENRAHLSSLVSQMMDEIRSGSDRLDTVFAERLTMIEERSSTMEQALTVGADGVRRALEQSAGTVAASLRGVVNEAGERFVEDAGRAGEEAEKRLVERTENLRGLFRDVDDQVERMGAKVEGLKGSLTDEAETVNRTLADLGDRFVLSAERAGDALRERVGDMEGRVQAVGSELARSVGGSTEEVAARIAELQAILASAESRLAEGVTQSGNSLNDRVEAIMQTIAAADSDFANVLDSNREQVRATVADVERVFAEADDRIRTRTSLTNNDLRSRAETIAKAFEELDSRLGAGAAEVEAALTRGADEASARFAAKIGETSSDLEKRTRELEDTITVRARELSEALDTTSAGISESAAARTREIEETLSARGRELNSSLALRAQDFNRILDETARPLIDRLAEQGSTLQGQLEDASRAATEHLRAENAKLVNALAHRTAETLTAMETARSSLTEEVGELIERLSVSNARLNQLVAGARDSFETIDGTLSASMERLSSSSDEASRNFATSIRLMDDNAGRLQELSGGTLRDIAAIASTFDQHGRMLREATDLMNSAQIGLSSTVEERQDALRDLADGLVMRSQEIERSMRGFETMVSSAISSVEGRAREATSTLSDELTQKTEAMRNSVTESTESLGGHVTSAVQSATGRFAEATEQMRQTAEQIRRELEETRNELKRGVFDLPDETRESTAKMRRAVADQIAALKELSQIVGESGSAIGQAQPEAQPVRAAAGGSPAVSQQLPPQEPRTVTAAPDRDRYQPGSAAMPRMSPEKSEPSPPQEGDSWVRGLLRRASDDEPVGQTDRRQPAPVADSLNSLSTDIARAIDESAATDAWKRYRAGDRNAFSRRLYTLKGQRTFEEIRQKYDQDREFHNAVDRYCQDFERLLQSAARDGTSLDGYLMSDQGKVFTMLAHASNRLR